EPGRRRAAARRRDPGRGGLLALDGSEVSRLLYMALCTALGAPLLVGCLGASTSSPAPIEVAAPGRWTSLAPLPTPRQEVAVAALRGHIWVMGGFGAAAEPTAAAESYDPATNAWTARPLLPTAVHHAAAVTVGERLFVLGGYAGGRVRWEPVGDVWEWNEARGAPARRCPAAAAGLPPPRCSTALSSSAARRRSGSSKPPRCTSRRATAGSPWLRCRRRATASALPWSAHRSTCPAVAASRASRRPTSTRPTRDEGRPRRAARRVHRRARRRGPPRGRAGCAGRPRRRRGATPRRAHTRRRWNAGRR